MSRSWVFLNSSILYLMNPRQDEATYLSGKALDVQQDRLERPLPCKQNNLEEEGVY